MKMGMNLLSVVCRPQVHKIINNVEIIACKLELFKNPIINIINQEISAEREGSIAIVSAP
jgi:hypothetical protein